jgi:Transposase DDE domain group 1
LLQQRVCGLCAGYADGNDAARLVHDPIHKLVVGRDPLSGLGLASQPTLSRFENAVTARELRAMTHVLADTVIAQTPCARPPNFFPSHPLDGGRPCDGGRSCTGRWPCWRTRARLRLSR